MDVVNQVHRIYLMLTHPRDVILLYIVLNTYVILHDHVITSTKSFVQQSNQIQMVHHLIHHHGLTIYDLDRLYLISFRRVVVYPILMLVNPNQYQ